MTRQEAREMLGDDFGMNLESGLVEAIGKRLAFWAVLGCGLLIGALLFALFGRPIRVRSRRNTVRD